MRDTWMKLDEIYEEAKPRADILAYMRGCVDKLKEVKDDIEVADKRLNPSRKTVKKIKDQPRFHIPVRVPP